MTELEKYIKEKIHLLTYRGPRQQGFGFKLTEKEIEHFNELKTEAAVDRYARDLMFKYL